MANILILLGGQWHDFDRFAKVMKPILEAEGDCVDITYDFETLTRLCEINYDLLLSYTCLTGAVDRKNHGDLTRFTDPQVDALVRWVRDGGALLAVHSATIIGDSKHTLEDLLGGAFIRHPPQLKFTVVPLSASHPITSGIEAFNVYDELYIERYDSSDTIHMVAIYEEVAYPLVWSRSEGQGRVAHIAPGHSSQTWENKTYQRLVLQTIRWLLDN